MQMNSARYEALAERLLICAYTLRDSPSWSVYADTLSAMGEIGVCLKEWDEACAWAKTAMSGTQALGRRQRS